MLKVFEEPTEGTHFFVLTPSSQFFLPTLLSRVVCIYNEGGSNNEEVTEFLKKSYLERLLFVVELKDDHAHAKRFIEDVTKYFYEKYPAEKRSKEISKTLELLIDYRSYANGKAPSLKNMLEHIALVAPAQ